MVQLASPPYASGPAVASPESNECRVPSSPKPKPALAGQMIDLPEDFLVFDGETGPQPDAALKKLCPPFEPPAHPGEFDPKAVKCGNLGPEKATAKVEAARKAHHVACQEHVANIKAGEAEHFAKFKKKAALDATTGHVVAIGLVGPAGVKILGDHNEAELLRSWWSSVEVYLAGHVPMVGFNIKHFDLPFFVRRSWILGVPIPSGVRVGRYWNDLFIDLMEVWNQGERGYVSLDTLCAAFGLPGKVTEVDGVEVSGATFHLLWESDRKVAIKYLEGDVLLPAELARRMQNV